jgi:acetyl esterase/lipase
LVIIEDRSILSLDAPAPDLALAEADVYFGDPARPVVMLVHGGFWRPEYDRVHLRPMAAALRDLGWPVYSIEFRREPGNPVAMVQDVRAALEAVNRDVIVVGHSAGGHLALLLNAPKTIALAPVADLTMARELGLDNHAVDDFLGSHEQRDFEPHAEQAVLVHGTEDQVVPYPVSQSYHAQHPSTRLVPLPGIGHFALIDPRSDAWPVVIQELERLLA